MSPLEFRETQTLNVNANIQFFEFQSPELAARHLKNYKETAYDKATTRFIEDYPYQFTIRSGPHLLEDLRQKKGVQRESELTHVVVADHLKPAKDKYKQTKGQHFINSNDIDVLARALGYIGTDLYLKHFYMAKPYAVKHVMVEEQMLITLQRNPDGAIRASDKNLVTDDKVKLKLHTLNKKTIQGTRQDDACIGFVNQNKLIFVSAHIK